MHINLNIASITSYTAIERAEAISAELFAISRPPQVRDEADVSTVLLFGLSGGGPSNNPTSTNVSPAATNAVNPTIHIASLAGTAVSIPQKFQELIFYPSDQTSNATAIETNINTFYSIY